ncbi:DUF2934 domain-containing protein [Xanthobacteraceae bacterium Astr-EGSB]|uniref:DUF2934 domain-containing protein n=1 Tax=Astrobacterium formosum TaxID=3069710 RepID=UPI0027B5656F|nr:DUF2934 domain-containing protein [Xanthobacteraceae bacterium Astr-EGSB]
MEDHTERVRQRAYQIWIDEGRPEGRESIHWDMASELVAIEENQTRTTKRVRRQPADKEIAADRAEPAKPAAAMGEVPTMTDMGEQTYPPSRAAARGTAPAKPAPSPGKTQAVKTQTAKTQTAKTPATKTPATKTPATKAPLTKISVNKTAAAKTASGRGDVARSSTHMAAEPKPNPRRKK